MSDSRTQSVCKNCQHPPAVHDHLGCAMIGCECKHFEPVAEPASTGESECGQFTGATFDGTPFHCKKPRGHDGSCNPLHGIVFEAARPSEPSAPQTGYCPSHGEKLVPIFGGQWNGCPKCPRDADGFTPSASHSPDRTTATDVAGEIDYMKSVDAAPQMSAEQWKKQCLGVGTCKCVGRCQFAPAPQPVSGDAPDMNDPRYCGACKHIHPPHEVDCRCYCDKVSCPECGPRIAARVMAEPAPSPTPSVSTPQGYHSSEPAELHRQVNIAKQNGARWIQVAVKDLEPLLAAPSVAGTQPTVHIVSRATDEERKQDCCGDRYTCNVALRCSCGKLLCDSDMKEHLLNVALAASDPGAAQETPQAQEIARELVFQFGVQGSLMCYETVLECLRKHGVGAPAQPGPEGQKK